MHFNNENTALKSGNICIFDSQGRLLIQKTMNETKMSKLMSAHFQRTYFYFLTGENVKTSGSL
jgi:hypothetical protein